MPHLLKSTELGSPTPPPMPSMDAQILEFRPRRKTRPPARPSRRSSPRPGEDEQDLRLLRGQVIEIIDAILAETSPEEADVRERLRRHVANHPGRPEKALLKHLLGLPL